MKYRCSVPVTLSFLLCPWRSLSRGLVFLNQNGVAFKVTENRDVLADEGVEVNTHSVVVGSGDEFLLGFLSFDVVVFGHEEDVKAVNASSVFGFKI